MLTESINSVDLIALVNLSALVSAHLYDWLRLYSLQGCVY
uniref:Uncharacterized protein n=1 Tax=Anguilla anguilla TaxID=7936 RepID=A0A0E9QPV4_ANGAN